MERNPLTALDAPPVLRLLFPVAPGKRVANGPLDEAAGQAAVEMLPVCAPDGIRLAASIFPGLAEEPHILFFPGEGTTGDSPAYLAEGFCGLGLSFLHMAYRGCGESEGEPSASSLLCDAEAFFQSALMWREARGRTGPLVLMGRSLGSALALDLAARHFEVPMALIIESGFDRTDQFLERIGVPVDVLGLRGQDLFQNRTKIGCFTKPVLFLHSHMDPVIRLSEVEWLVAESRSKATQFQVIPGEDRFDLAHRAGELYFTFIRDFLNRLLGRRPVRRRKAP